MTCHRTSISGVSSRACSAVRTSTHAGPMDSDYDMSVPMRDGVELCADTYRPATPGRYPVLVSASPYPRQIQNLGAPLGFIEAGASDFFVPRGYVHGIANIRGTLSHRKRPLSIARSALHAGARPSARVCARA
ncbi:CocE/NonD family hydrolase [Caballeronia sp.]|uniref:CocE/NonD family hydrolase n=1 Tax=Caballeronia sp. TaxID=1931223 RepID=UPI003C6F3CD4